MRTGKALGRRDRGTRVGLGLSLALSLMLALPLACASAPERYAPFERAEPPEPGEARVYIYRVDGRARGSAVALDLDGKPLPHLRNGQYLTLTVPAGRHAIGARWLSLLSGTRSDIGIAARPGATVYVHLFADYQQLDRPGEASETAVHPALYSSVRHEIEALPLLSSCVDVNRPIEPEPAATP